MWSIQYLKHLRANRYPSVFSIIYWKTNKQNLTLIIFCVNHPIYAKYTKLIFDLIWPYMTHPRRIQPLPRRTIQSLSISHHISPSLMLVIAAGCLWFIFPAFSQHFWDDVPPNPQHFLLERHFACRAPSRAASRRVPPWTRTLGMAQEGETPNKKWMGKGMEGLGLRWFTIEIWKI
jgi:hypothetical protein